MKPNHISLISFAAISLCGCSSPQPTAPTPPPRTEYDRPGFSSAGSPVQAPTPPALQSSRPVPQNFGGGGSVGIQFFSAPGVPADSVTITANSVTSTRPQPVKPASDSQPVVQTPTRLADAKLLQALDACAPVQDPLVSISAPNYGTSSEIHTFLEAQLRATTFSTALARAVEKAASLGTNISVKLSNPKTCNLGKIQEILGKEDSKYDADVNEIPDAIRPIPVTWYRYGWGEFAIRDDVVVAVRGKTDGFRRKE